MRRLTMAVPLLVIACGGAPSPGEGHGELAAPSTAPSKPPSANGPVAGSEPCPRADAGDRAALTEELTCILSRYVRLDTTNPPGNERLAADFLRDVLARDGIEAQIIESEPGRANVYARIRGDGSKKAIVLLHHMDVVPADPAEWTVPPLSGEVRDGELWGRGSLDNKGVGVMTALAAALLRRTQTTLSRDVIVLGVADEEAGGGLGARYLVEKHPELFEGVEFVINEGGAIIALDETRRIYSVERAQKAPLWLRLTASGTSGHASSPRPDAAVHALVRALGRLEAHEFPIHVTPEVQAVFAAKSKSAPAPLAARYADLRASLADPAFRAKFLENPREAALVRNTLSITMLAGSDKENVVPARASAVVDLRLLPGVDAAQVTADLTRVMAEPAVKVEPILSWTAYASPEKTALFEAITAVAAKADPGAPVVFDVIGGFTDCNAFRAKGITCYGFVPVRVTLAEVGRIHGKDERVSIEALVDGVGATGTLLREVSAR